MEKRLVDLTKTDVLEDGDYLFVNHGDNPVQVSFPFIKEQIAPNDTTLSESGKFADAKVVGDKLNEHSQSIETINTEIEAIKDDYATKEETETKSHAEETFATKISLSSLQEDLNGVKEDYLTKQEDQENRDTEFYEGRKYNGMTYAGKTSDKGVQLHSVKGKTVQQTTNGYQLFDASKIATTSQGGATVTNNGDGSFTISGSGNLTDTFSNMQYSINSYDFKKLFKVGNVYLKGAINKGIYFEVTYIKSDGNLYQRNNQTINLTNEIYNAITSVAIIFYGNSGNAIPNETVKPMLYQDGDGTWEPYTGGKPAPNPDYPMEIENVEISEISSTNNFLNEKNIEIEEKYLNSDNNLVNNVDWSVTKYLSIPSNVEKLNFRIIGISPAVCFYDESKTFISGEKYADRITFIVDIPKNAKFMRLSKNKTATHYYCCVYPNTAENNGIETYLTLAEGDTYESGQVTRVRKQITFDGSSDENWSLQSTNSYGIANFKIDMAVNNLTDGCCNRFILQTSSIAATQTEGFMFSDYGDGTLFIRISKDKASTATELKTWLSTHPVTIEYELETPTTEELKIPTIPSYYPYTEVSTDNELETDMTWKVLADCDNSLAQEELEQRILALETKAIE